MINRKAKDLQKRLIVDIDGTLCKDTGGANYIDPEPKEDVIKAVNKRWQDGWHVTIFTARGMVRFGGDVNLIEAALRDSTEKWLEKHRVCYDRLVFGKPAGDQYLDDRAVTPSDFVLEVELV